MSIWISGQNAIDECLARLGDPDLSPGEQSQRYAFVQACIDVLDALTIEVTVEGVVRDYVDGYVEGVAEVRADDEACKASNAPRVSPEQYAAMVASEAVAYDAVAEDAAFTSVFDYFTHMIGHAPSDDTLRNLPTDSMCGIDCVAAIDAARNWHGINKTALDDAATAAIYSRLERVISVFWHG